MWVRTEPRTEDLVFLQSACTFDKAPSPVLSERGGTEGTVPPAESDKHCGVQKWEPILDYTPSIKTKDASWHQLPGRACKH